jgi:FkbM family methyltransferase
MNIRPIIEVIKKCARFFGCDVVMYRPCLEIIEKEKFDLVLDIGANEGQFGRELRQSGYTKKIISFEPTKQAFNILKKSINEDKLWECYNFALGKENGTARLNIHEDTRLSSFLEHHDLPSRQTQVQLKKLSSFLEEIGCNAKKIFIKIDTQGYEMPILEGVGDFWEKIHGALVELSIAPLYKDQIPLEEMIAYLKKHGLSLWRLRRGCYDQEILRDLEVDGLFMKKDQSN